MLELSAVSPRRGWFFTQNLKIIKVKDMHRLDSSKDIYFCSDHHFFHANIIDYCNRPFSSVEEMNIAMVENWNARIAHDDIVYYLGDMFMGIPEKWFEIRKKLNGKVHFILGNHDRKNKLEWMGFESIQSEVHLKIIHEEKEYSLYLRHKPDVELARKFDLMLCGHVHNSWKTMGNVVNLSIDVWNYKPVKFAEILSRYNESL